MRKAISLFLLLAMILTGCNIGPRVVEPATPPDLTITTSNKSITAVRGTYSWQGVQLDSEAPPDLVKYQGDNLDVKSMSLITLRFSKMPVDYKVTIWQEKNQVMQQISNGSLMTPQQKGLAVYEVYASWKEGNSYYAFSVNIGL